MTLIFIYLIGALGLSFLCSILEAVLLSTPISFIAMKENEGAKYAKYNYRINVTIFRNIFFSNNFRIKNYLRNNYQYRPNNYI